MRNFLFWLIVLGAFACKKKETNPAGQEDPVGAKAVTSGSLSASTGGNFCDLKTYYGYVDYHGSVSVDSTVWARFFKDSTASANVYAGTVIMNGNTLAYDSLSASYVSVQGMSVNICGTLSWSVSGSGTVTAFSQSFTPSYPKYTGASLLPDTCSKSAGITIQLSGITNHAGGAAVKILSSGQSTQYKYITGSAGSCTFSPQDLAAFSVNSAITIYISIDNNYSASLGGVKRGFSNSLYYKKVSFLKP